MEYQGMLVGCQAVNWYIYSSYYHDAYNSVVFPDSGPWYMTSFLWNRAFPYGYRVLVLLGMTPTLWSSPGPYTTAMEYQGMVVGYQALKLVHLLFIGSTMLTHSKYVSWRGPTLGWPSRLAERYLPRVGSGPISTSISLGHIACTQWLTIPPTPLTSLAL